MTPPLLYAKDGAVATITFNRPEARNALTPEMLCLLADAFVDLQADDAIRVAILTGAGDKAFCAGGDLARTLPLMSGARPPEDEWDRRLLSDPLVAAASSLRTFALAKPLIAAVNGACLAAGAELLLATDIRIAVAQATFGWPEVTRGLLPFAGSMARLPRQVPHAEAMRLMLTGESIDAAEALRIGLVNRIVDPAQLMTTARALADRIAANAPIAVQQVKRAVVESSGRPLADAYGVEDEARRIVFASDDAKEGPSAFMEKRAPVYRGR